MISKELILFLKENKDLINENTKESWEEIYNKLYNSIFRGEFTGEFTQTILDAGINDPASIIGYVPGYYLYNGSKIKDYIIPSNVTSIGASAFGYCSSLVRIEIPNSVISIGEHAFDYCSNLTSVIIPDSVTSIGDWAFSLCINLTSVVIPDSVTSIGEYAFYYCTSLKEIQFKGTKKDALTKLNVRNKSWREDSSIKKITCLDGEIIL